MAEVIGAGDEDSVDAEGPENRVEVNSLGVVI
jgi:hypothetical protein